jgi:hypothetical protein
MSEIKLAKSPCWKTDETEVLTVLNTVENMLGLGMQTRSITE